MTYRARIALLAAVVVFSGCATSLEVKKVTKTNRGTTHGLRYSLPKPFVLVSPDPAVRGGYKVEIVYLPDTNQTYAIAADSKMGSYTLNVEVKDGLLSKVEWVQDGGDVAAEATRVAGEIAKADLDRRIEERKKAEEEAEEQAAKKEALEKAVADAKLALKQAETELEFWKPLASAPGASDNVKQKRIEAELKKIEAEEKLAQAQAALDEFNTESGAAANDVGIFNDPSLAPPPGPADQKTTVRQVHGPVLYEIVDNCDPFDCGKSEGTVSLQRAKWNRTDEGQITFSTVAVKKDQPKPKEIKLINPAGVATLDFSGQPPHQMLKLEFSGELNSWDRGNSTVETPDGKLEGDALKDLIESVSEEQGNKKIWLVKIHESAVKKGKYVFALVFKADPAGNMPVEAKVEVNVVK